MESLGDIVKLVLAVASLVTAITALVKVFKCGDEAHQAKAETERIDNERTITKVMRDNEFHELKERVALLENENSHIKADMDDGSARFEKLEGKMDKMNETLIDISATLKEMRRSSPSHQPEER